jgi:quinol monooxygenase YgiN
MITTFVEMHVKPEMEQKFIEALDVVKCAFERAEGCQGFVLHRSVEDRGHYILRVAWKNLALGTEVFQSTSGYRMMLDEVSVCLASDLRRWYTETVTSIGQFRRFADMDLDDADQPPRHFS